MGSAVKKAFAALAAVAAAAALIFTIAHKDRADKGLADDAGSAPQTKEQILARVDELKALVDSKYWPGFNDPKYVLEMHYYEDGPFRMHLIQNENDSVPRMECSSPEITFATIPDVRSYEEWYAMLIHEFFHGFQFRKYPAFWDRGLEVNPEDFYASDSLMALKANYGWYADMLAQESELLSQMYDAGDVSTVRDLFARFMPIREERLRAVKEKLGLDITEFYPITEAREGSARYIEYCLYKEQGIDDTDWMFNLDGGSYYYASGFYMLLIMDRFGIDYKADLFDRYFTITDLLRAKLGE